MFVEHAAIKAVAALGVIRKASSATDGRRGVGPHSRQLRQARSAFMTTGYVVAEQNKAIGIARLNRPERLNAWTGAMRDDIMVALHSFEAAPEIRAIVMTGTGNRAFCAGQDLAEAQGFTTDEAEAWIRGWGTFYAILRGLTKPLVMALNGLAAGSAFQALLMGDVRVAHPGVTMGQPEINSGIASVTGPWIMNLMLGMSRTIELTISGRLMAADECERIGLIHHLVTRSDVLPRSLEVARATGCEAACRDAPEQDAFQGDDGSVLPGGNRSSSSPPSVRPMRATNLRG